MTPFGFFLTGLPSACIMIGGLILYERRMARIETKMDLLWGVFADQLRVRFVQPKDRGE
jgi:hypothetical protein